MRIFYDIIFMIFSVFYFPFLFLKGKMNRDLLEKFGRLPGGLKNLDNPVWIHAVSVGEAVLASRLSAEIKARYPEVKIVVSTTTRTGNDMIRKSGKVFVDAVFYYPLDISFIVSKVLNKISPRLYIMVETELWPNLLNELSSRGIPAALVNGRISDSSFKNYKMIDFVTKKILSGISAFCMQSERDKDHIIELGAAQDRVTITGNMKFDEGLKHENPAGISKENVGFNGQDEIIVAGSTHFPEEQNLIDVFKDLILAGKNLKLVLAPRHIERTEAVKIYVEKAGLKYNLFSETLKDVSNTKPGTADVLLVDTIGHLKNIYSIASVVVIGGSFAERGGQNPIEAARWGKPVVFGPNMQNFHEISGIFLENEAACQVEDTEQAKTAVLSILNDADKREMMSLNSKKVIEQNTGAVVLTVDKLKKYIENVQ